MDIATAIVIVIVFIASFYLGRLYERAVFVEKSKRYDAAQKIRPVDRYYSLDREVQRRKE